MPQSASFMNYLERMIQQAEEMFHLTLADMAVFVTEFVNIIHIVFIIYKRLGIEQWLVVLTLCGTRLKFKE